MFEKYNKTALFDILTEITGGNRSQVKLGDAGNLADDL